MNYVGQDAYVGQDVSGGSDVMWIKT
jgi:hypothetical protein